MRIQMQRQNTVLKILMVLEHGAPDAWPDSVIPPRLVQICDVAATGHTALRKVPCSKDALLVEKRAGQGKSVWMNTDTSSAASRDWRHYLSVQRTAKGQLLARAGPPHFPEAAAWVIEPHVRTYSTPLNTEKCHIIQMEPGNLDRAGTAPASLVTLGNKSIPLIFSIHKIKGMTQCF